MLDADFLVALRLTYHLSDGVIAIDAECFQNLQRERVDYTGGRCLFSLPNTHAREDFQSPAAGVANLSRGISVERTFQHLSRAVGSQLELSPSAKVDTLSPPPPPGRIVDCVRTTVAVEYNRLLNEQWFP